MRTSVTTLLYSFIYYQLVSPEINFFPWISFFFLCLEFYCTTSLWWWKETFGLEVSDFENNYSGERAGMIDCIWTATDEPPLLPPGLKFTFRIISSCLKFLSLYVWLQNDHRTEEQADMFKNSLCSFRKKPLLESLHCKANGNARKRIFLAWYLQICSLEDYKMCLLVVDLEIVQVGLI